MAPSPATTIRAPAPPDQDVSRSNNPTPRPGLLPPGEPEHVARRPMPRRISRPRPERGGPGQRAETDAESRARGSTVRRAAPGAGAGRRLVVSMNSRRRAREPGRFGDMREVARPLEDRQPAGRHRTVRLMGVFDRDDPVVGAPHQQRRDLVHEVEPVAGADPLATVVHDGAQGVDERAADVSVGEAGVRPGRLDHARVGPESDGGAQPADGAGSGDQVPVGHQPHEVVGARERGRTEGDADLGAQPATRHEGETVAAFRVLIGELHRDPAAERVTDHRCGAMPQLVEEVTDEARVRPERVVAWRRRRPPVPREVEHHDGAPRRKVGDDRVPRPIVPARPWTSTTTGPVPSCRNATDRPCTSRVITQPRSSPVEIVTFTNLVDVIRWRAAEVQGDVKCRDGTPRRGRPNPGRPLRGAPAHGGVLRSSAG